jgi:triosephosphate isomerase
MIILNLKTYTESTVDNLSKLLDALRALQEKNPELGRQIYVAPSTMDLVWAKKNYPELNIIAQHVDTKSAGSTTGWVPAENLIRAGVEYAIINHSEHRVWDENVVEELKDLQDKGLKLIVCCENTDEAIKVLEAHPFAIAYEPKDLIGSGVSVTTRPEAVTEFIAATKGKTNILIGAGVSTKEDVEKGIELGADGALLASAFVKSADPEAKAMELIAPFIS